ncbi:MAG: DUF5672 family protein [Eubacteriales bacterium]|nr:DUF5672 family protein [Eubacteriales bacterium]
MRKIQLQEVTMVAAASVKIEETVKALRYSMRGLSFGEVLFFSHRKPNDLPRQVKYVQISEMCSIDDYNRTMLFEVYKYIRTPFVLVIQWDGFVVHPEQWRQDFLQYDYIGALWPAELNYRDRYGQLCRVGNGGISLRSRQLMALPDQEKLPWHAGENEDIYLCCLYRHVLEKYGMRYAPLEVACRFAHERTVPENKGVVPFAFHQWEGSNAQYPEFGRGMATQVRRLVIRLLIRMGLYEAMRRCFLKSGK